MTWGQVLNKEVFYFKISLKPYHMPCCGLNLKFIWACVIEASLGCGTLSKALEPVGGGS